MADDRVTAFARSLLDRAGDFAARTPMRSATIQLGPSYVRVAVPEGPSTRPDVLGAFWLADIDRPDFSLTIVDDRSGPLLDGLDLPPDAHFPLGVVDPAASYPYRVAVDEHTKTISVFDPGAGRCVTWIRSLTDLPYWAAATPFRLQLSWLADTFGGEFVHGAAIVRQDRALMLGGNSGSGKSTMSLLAASAGDGLVSDDFLLWVDGHVHAVYTRAKLHEDGLGASGLKHLSVLPVMGPGEKRIIDLSASEGIDMVPSARLAALLLPVVPERSAAGSAGLTTITAGRALLMLAPPSLSGLLGGLPGSLPRLRALTQSVPAYRWNLTGLRTADLARLDQIWDALAADELAGMVPS